MRLEFFGDGPALLVEERQRNLVVADLHFGIEADLAAHGMFFRSRSAARLDRLMKVIGEADPDALILLGDVKHSIPSGTRQEYFEMPGLLAALRRRVPLLVFPGNHDIGIERYLAEGELQPKEGKVIDGVGYLHGHTYPDKELAGHLIVIGHHHPLLVIRDEVGCALQTPAYIRADLDTGAIGMEEPSAGSGPTRVLFVPAFNEIAGYDIRQILKKPFAPVSKFLREDGIEIILADGSYFGPAGMLKEDDDD
ncbi:MAG TPA: metallophosphoesterase [Methanoregula sp.]|nr:metallophosphoesterase [Methanoregula sp.]